MGSDWVEGTSTGTVRESGLSFAALPHMSLVQYRFPRSKRRRIRKKWAKDQRNYRLRVAEFPGPRPKWRDDPRVNNGWAFFPASTEFCGDSMTFVVDYTPALRGEEEEGLGK